ncbi:MAG: ribosomal protein S6 [Lentimonas sp.]|jgi:ribosomal protein S6
MSATTTNNYKTTFILDLRESEDDSAKVLADLTEILASLGGTVTESEDLGVREFVRAADRRYTQGNILEVYFDGPGTVPSQLQEKLRLDKRVNRIFVQSV